MLSNYKSIMFKISILILVLLLYSCSHNQAKIKPNLEYDFWNTELSREARIDDLLNRMTIQEKISQLTSYSPAIERLNIPAYDWWNECLHGVARAGEATVFPQAIGMAATWNPDLIHKVADIISTEARAKYHEAVRNGDRSQYKGLTFWSPNINIFRDPRWGRGQETYGEDPYLTSQIGIAFVKGIQGDDSKYLKAAACAKHFAVHSGPEHLRHEFDITVSKRDLHETYLPAFKALVKEAGVEGVMCAYNRYKGEACCGSNAFLNGILRNQWGFDGYIVSDCGAISDIFKFHKIVDTAPEAAALALKSGTDVNCGRIYPSLEEALKEGLIEENDIDKALRHLFNIRLKLGMFDPPEMVPYAHIPIEKNNDLEHGKMALETARQSIVLLKNENSTLPLSKHIKNIAVIGPNADSYESLLGNYHGTPVRYTTILSGIKQTVSETTIVNYALGVNYLGEKYKLEPIPAEAFIYNGKNGINATYYSNMKLEGQPVTVRIDKDINQEYSYGSPLEGMPTEKFSICWEGQIKPEESGNYYIGVTGDDGFRLYFEGKLVLDSWKKGRARTLVFQTDMKEGNLYSFKLEYFDRYNNAQVMLGWHLPHKDIHKEAIVIAENSDAIIYVGGITPRLEGEEMDENSKFEGFYRGDRTKISLPLAQSAFLKELAKLNKPIIFVNMSGSAVSMLWEDQNIPAIIQAWYPGQAGGQAVADVIFGNYNPAGRLPVTVYQSVNQLPDYENYNMDGRTYRYFKGDVTYPFGYGLSYSDFEYKNLTITPDKLTGSEDIIIKVDIVNQSKIAGDEVVQVYISDNQADYPVPIKSLKAFKRVHLNPGENKTVQFQLKSDDFGLYDENMQRVIEAGDFTIIVGGSSLGGLRTTINADHNILLPNRN